jgi:hypothetical protein
MANAQHDSPEAALKSYKGGTDREVGITEPQGERDAPCDTESRTKGIGFRNQSSWGIEIAFFQLISVAPPRPGYTQNTGVIRACRDIPPRTDCGVDPCLAMSAPNLPILGTTAKGSANLTKGGQTVAKNFPDNVAEPGKAWKFVGWDIKDTAETDEPIVTLRYERDDTFDL